VVVDRRVKSWGAQESSSRLARREREKRGAQGRGEFRYQVKKKKKGYRTESHGEKDREPGKRKTKISLFYGTPSCGTGSGELEPALKGEGGSGKRKYLFCTKNWWTVTDWQQACLEGNLRKTPVENREERRDSGGNTSESPEVKL